MSDNEDSIGYWFGIYWFASKCYELQGEVMQIYLVVRCGAVCRHIFGCYDSYDDALLAAKTAKDLEPDNYHSFMIQTLIVGQDLNTGKVADYMKSPIYKNNDVLVQEGRAGSYVEC